ncbi:MAG: TonB-dependent receptor, partial [Novosphingobium sp.]|nr:TonB-dependent receptor [Novosphingobium sp.]
MAQTTTGEAPAPAQPGTRTTAYDAAFFAPFAPATALDIVRRVPGFMIAQSNGNVRGFAGAAGNVVFNGARASSKSDSIETILARIPANRVARIEIGPGDLYGSDFSGKSQVLNVIFTAEGGVDGNATVKAARVYGGRIVPNADASVLVRRGTSSINLAAGTGRFDSQEKGFDRLSALPGGQLIEFRRKVNIFKPRQPFVSASWGVEQAADRAFHVNARWAPNTFDLVQTNLVTPASGPLRDDRLVQRYDTPGYELGGDVSRPLAGGTIKFVALANRRDRKTYDASFNRIAGETVGGFEQRVDSRYDEVLGRLSWARANLLGLSFELGSELAYNRLDNATELFLVGGDGGRSQIDLP